MPPELNVERRGQARHGQSLQRGSVEENSVSRTTGTTGEPAAREKCAGSVSSPSHARLVLLALFRMDPLGASWVDDAHRTDNRRLGAMPSSTIRFGRLR